MKFLAVFLIIAVVLAGGGTAAWLVLKNRSNAASAASTVQTAEVARRTIAKSVGANGKVVSNQDIDIKCRASGEIIEMPYDVSASVEPGALLLKLDTKEQQRAVRSAEAQVLSDEARLKDAQFSWDIAKLKLETARLRVEASLKSAEARAKDAKSKAERVRGLFAEQLASKEELETAETAALQADSQWQTEKAAKLELEQQEMEVGEQGSFKLQRDQIQQTLAQNKEKLQTAQDNLEYCTVRSPLGDDSSDPPKWRVKTITTNVRKGYLVQSGTSGNSGGTTVMTLSDLSHIFVLANVPESEIGGIAAGQRVTITTDAWANLPFEGRVVRLGADTTTNNVVTFEVKIEIVSENRLLLLPGLTTTVSIVTASRENVLAIPIGAFSRASREDREAAENQGAATQATTDPQATVGQVATNDVSVPAQPPAGARGRGGRGRGGRGAGGGGAAPPALMLGNVQVQKDGKTEPRRVTVGINDGEYYEVVQGEIQEGDIVIVNQTGGDSRWRGGNQGGGGRGAGNVMPRGFTGGGGGAGGGGRGR